MLHDVFGLVCYEEGKVGKNLLSYRHMFEGVMRLALCLMDYNVADRLGVVNGSTRVSMSYWRRSYHLISGFEASWVMNSF